MLKKLLLLCLTVLAITSVAIAQNVPPDLLWRSIVPGQVDNSCYSVHQTNDGGYILAGYCQTGYTANPDFFLSKTDSMGQQLWSRHFGRTGTEICWSAQITEEGGFIMLGETNSYGPLGKNVWLLKTNANGDSIWSRTYGGSGDEVGHSVVQTDDGGYVLAGYTTSFGSGAADFWLIKTDDDGYSVWTMTYGAEGADSCHSVQLTQDGGFILAGSTRAFGTTDTNFLLIKTDSEGTQTWGRTYGGGNQELCHAVIEATSGGYLLVGSTNTFGAGYDDFWAVRTNETGNELWNKTIGKQYHDICTSVVETSDQKFILGGWSYSDDSYGAMYLAKLDVDGDSLWTQSYGNDWEGEFCYSVAITNDDGYILGGQYQHWEWPFGQCLLMKTRPEVLGLAIDLIPHNPPIQVPPGGGSFLFDVVVNNYSETTAYTVDVWLVMTLPDGNPYPTGSRLNMNLPPHTTLVRANLTQFIPGTAVAGTYHYTGYVADHYTYQEYCQDAFIFTKLPGDASSLSEYSWDLYGWDDDVIASAAPTEFALHAPHPNPFNATTALQFDLIQSGMTNLSVYDVAGRLVLTLVNGWRSAGRHEITLDGNGLSSGIYLVSLRAGGFQAAQKVILLK
jgi:hypothetical protein